MSCNSEFAKYDWEVRQGITWDPPAMEYYNDDASPLTIPEWAELRIARGFDMAAMLIVTPSGSGSSYSGTGTSGISLAVSLSASGTVGFTPVVPASVITSLPAGPYVYELNASFSGKVEPIVAGGWTVNPRVP